MVIELDTATAGDGQVAFDVISHVTTCPLVKVPDVNAELFVPAFTPLTFHW
jgi:hypothetical protein